MTNMDEIMLIRPGFERIEPMAETTTACKPLQNRMLIVISKLSALLFANLRSAQPLTAPTLIH